MVWFWARGFLVQDLLHFYLSQFLVSVFVLFPYPNFHFSGLMCADQRPAQLLALLSVSWRILVRFALVLPMAVLTSCLLMAAVQEGPVPVAVDQALTSALLLLLLCVTSQLQPAVYSVTVLPWMPGSPWLELQLLTVSQYWLWLQQALAEAPGLVIRLLENVALLTLYILYLDWVTDLLKVVLMVTAPPLKPRPLRNICYRKFAPGVDEFCGSF